MIEETRVLELFGQGFDCSQVVLSESAESVGIHREMALRAAAAFGGGMWQGETCGCVTGALMAIGLKYGHDQAGDEKTKNAMLAKKAKFEAAFKKAWGSCICKEILGYDLSVPEEMQKIGKENLLATKCPAVAAKACAILEDIL